MTFFLRLVLPKIVGINTLHGELMGCVPKELGSVSPLRPWPIIGMTFEIDVGLPTAMNTMELASLCNMDGDGGIFFADVTSHLQSGRAPLQFNLSWDEVVVFWTADIRPRGTVSPPTLAIGVHQAGDWHRAVDYYVAAHRRRARFPDAPAWLREAGGLYSCSTGGAGAIYLAPGGLPRIDLQDGAVHATFERNNGSWTDGEKTRLPESLPVQISTAGFAPAGAPLLALKQEGTRQVDVIAAKFDGALWTTWEPDGGAWQDGRWGRLPQSMSPPDMSPAGAMLTSEWQNAQQLDVFWAGKDNALWVTWKVGQSAWQDGIDGRIPKRITPTGVAHPGGGVAAAKQNAQMLDVFWVKPGDGAIWVTFEVNDGAWCDGEGERHPLRVSPADLAHGGAPLAAIKHHANQLDVFVVDRNGASIGSHQTARDGILPVGIALRGGEIDIDQSDAVFECTSRRL